MGWVRGTARYPDTRVLQVHAAVLKYQDLGTLRILPFELHAFHVRALKHERALREPGPDRISNSQPDS